MTGKNGPSRRGPGWNGGGSGTAHPPIIPSTIHPTPGCTRGYGNVALRAGVRGLRRGVAKGGVQPLPPIPPRLLVEEVVGVVPLHLFGIGRRFEGGGGVEG